VVDGYADLDLGGRPGPGAHAHAEFGIPVIGVAKSQVPHRYPRGTGHARILGTPAVHHGGRDVPAPTERTWSGAWPTASPADLRRRAERRMRMSGTRLPAKAPDFGDEPHDVFRCAGNEVNDLVQLDIWRRQLPVAGLHFQVHFLVGDRIISDPDEAAPADGSAGFQLRDPWWRRCAQSSEGALLDLV
jgi:hypothetical protein